MPKIDTVTLRNLKCRKEILEAEVGMLTHLKGALCIRELTNAGRVYVNKVLKKKQDDIRTIESQISSG